MLAHGLPFEINSSDLETEHLSTKNMTTSLVERLLGYGYSQIIFYLVSFILVSIIYSYATSCKSLPLSIPWIGKDSRKLFAETRAHLTSFTKVKQWLQEGYDKVGV
jgi:hypothetical protein